MNETARTDAGGLSLDNELWLAPLAGLTMPPVRQFFSRLGAGLTHTEMVSCAGLVRNNAKTLSMLRLLPDEGPVVLQLFCSDADTLVRGGEAALAHRQNPEDSRDSLAFAALGINMACPMPKVMKHGAGAALLHEPRTAFEMTRGLKTLGLPVWIKIRRIAADLGETLRFVEGLIEAGADNVCIHGRTAAQRYEGRGDRTTVKSAACRFPGKISASGDVYTVEDVLEYKNMGCVGVMLARGALLDPCLFPRALRALGRDIPDEQVFPGAERQIERLKTLGESAKAVCGPRLAVVLLKRLAGGTLRGIPGASELRRRLGAAREVEELLEILQRSIVAETLTL
ncbi:MAG: tRNA-dihydrouridine synthase family protein [Synergistaceae bacterium]|jgi:tRNA-dihydrouridine synthase|nr:tRNA-dihydrouridine synthase family protein [Synergistaceae bacterium]